ncbi:hypothetical protein C8R43DRAFT_982978 [Mycena crocata]|nr:hypothetical protein C8R43DRAFT_982978 [Mycena crocata]
MPSPGHLALVTGLVSSSYFAFANIGGAFFGVMPATARGNTALPTKDRLALWHFAYEIGKVHMAGSGITSAVALSYVAYVTPNPLRKILIAGAAAAYASAVFTFLFLMPINNDLIATLQSTSSKTMEPKQEQRVLGQLDKWRALHRARIVLGIISWAASLTTVLASGPFIQFVFL